MVQSEGSETVKLTETQLRSLVKQTLTEVLRVDSDAFIIDGKKLQASEIINLDALSNIVSDLGYSQYEADDVLAKMIRAFNMYFHMIHEE